MEIRPNALPNKIQIGAALRFRAPAMRGLRNLSITSPGSSTVKVESRPGPALSAQIEPRCSSTSAFQIQAEATELASDFHTALLKKIQDTRERFRRNANPVILYLQFPFSAHLPSSRYPDNTIPGVSARLRSVISRVELEPATASTVLSAVITGLKMYSYCPTTPVGQV